MKMVKVMLLTVGILALAVSFAFAAGDAEKGKALFGDPKLGGATAGKSCNDCHKDDMGKIAKLAAKSDKEIQDQVNKCIKGGMKGKGLDAKSAELANVTAYIKTVKAPAAAAPAPAPKKKKAVEGC